MRLSQLIGNWIDPKGRIWTVRKAHDRSNTFLDIEFSTDTQYHYPLNIFSKFIFGEYWNRFDSKSFQSLVQEFELKKEILA